MTKRRQKGEGSITTLKNGKVRIRVEVEPVDGKRKWLSAIADTKTEAIKKLKEMQRVQEDTKKVEAYRNTFGDYVEPYIKARRGDGVKETSLQGMQIFLREATKFFGCLPVNHITPEHTTILYKSYIDKGNQEVTANSKINTVRVMFEWLKFKGLISSIPFSAFRKKTNGKKNNKKNLEVLSITEHKKLKECMGDYFYQFLTENHWTLTYRFLPIYLLAYETGMREGELAGLKWNCVDFKNNTVSVNSHSIVLIGRGVLDSTLKTNAGYRTIKISQETTDVLRKLKNRYEETKFTSEYVFGNRNKQGKSYLPQMLLRTFKQFLWDIGIYRPFTFHDIRHTNASIMFNKKIDETIITERLGHSSISTTLRVYTHTLQECKDKDKAVVTA